MVQSLEFFCTEEANEVEHAYIEFCMHLGKATPNRRSRQGCRDLRSATIDTGMERGAVNWLVEITVVQEN